MRLIKKLLQFLFGDKARNSAEDSELYDRFVDMQGYIGSIPSAID